jgi:ribosomal protein L36
MSDQTMHEALFDYERGTQTFLGELGHWHAVPNSHGERAGRMWVKGRVEDCQAVKRARVVRHANRTPAS